MTQLLDGLHRLYIDGEYAAAGGGAEDVVNPGSEEVFGQAPLADQSDLDRAIAAARRAFDDGPWPRRSAAERAEHMVRFHAALARRRDRFAQIIMAEGGAVRADAWARQFDSPMKHLRHNIETGKKQFARVLDPVVTDFGSVKALGGAVVERVPVGVVGAISAFNYPTFLNLAKIGPALMAGNTMVLKPSELTPFQALLLGEAADEAELPAGVLNVINGGSGVGAALSTDERVDLLSFTGSDRVGSMIAEQGAPTLKRVLLELGGKSPLIVRPDANLNMAAKATLRGFTAHAGQGCAMLTRSLVHNSVREQFVAHVAELAKSVVVGEPTNPDAHMGPLISAAQRERVERYVQLGQDEGATLVFGGSRPAEFERGYYFQPTLFDDVDNKSSIAQNEIFGPVGVVVGFDTDEEAIALANDSKFGLRAGVMTADTGLAYEIAQQLRVGQVLINGGSLTALSDAPFGGLKRSGYGREGGDEGFLAYTDARTIEYHAG
jgi:acyl-CoA reductase-like NAD-dependent aldehyde dehydrogenase